MHDDDGAPGMAASASISTSRAGSWLLCSTSARSPNMSSVRGRLSDQKAGVSNDEPSAPPAPRSGRAEDRLGHIPDGVQVVPLGIGAEARWDRSGKALVEAQQAPTVAAGAGALADAGAVPRRERPELCSLLPAEQAGGEDLRDAPACLVLTAGPTSGRRG
jgi:hypothetical protein